MLVLTLVLVLLAASVPASAQPVVVVTTVNAKPFPLTVEALGNALANESVEIRPKVTERIAAIRFEEGQRVAAGSVLVELENVEARAAVASARAAEAESASQLRRARELFETRAIAASEIEQLTARNDAYKAALDSANSRLADTVVRAPFGGRLGLRRVSPGSLVGPNTIITTLDDTAIIKLDFDVPETLLARIEPGLEVIARSAAWRNEIFVGQVASVDTRVDPVSRTVTVRAAIPNPDYKLRPGMFLTVAVLKDKVTALVIPEEAIVPEQSRQYVFVVGDGDLVEKREVRTGRRRPGEVEVLDGLRAGERVVTEGVQKAKPGSSVRLMQAVE